MGGNHVASVVASVGVPNLSNLLHMGVAPAPAAVVAEAASEAALTAVVVASVEAVVVVLAVGEEEDTETEEDLATEEDSETEAVAVSEEVVAVASEEAEMTLDHREVEVATGSCSAE